MARTLALGLLLPGVAHGLRKGLHEKAEEDIVPEDAERDIWDRLAESANTSDVVAQWTPCTLGMCWRSWGRYRDSRHEGVGGIGNGGCRPLFSGCESKGLRFMDCVFGPCPKNFGSPACVSTSGCRSYCDVQYRGTCRYDGPRQSSTYASWMREFQSKRLNTLMMVEGHHYLAQLGTLDFHKPVKSSEQILQRLSPIRFIPGAGDVLRVAYASLLPQWSSCQSADTVTLLNSGVRAFDIRPYLSNSTNGLRDSHGGRGLEIEPALSSIASFVRSQRSEIVFVNLQNVLTGSRCLDCKSDAETFQRINSAVQKHFGNCGGGMLLCNVNVSKTVGELVQSGNVIVHTNSWNVHTGSGSPRRIHSSSSMYTAPWYNTNSLTKLKSAMLADTRTQDTARGSSHMIAHQWVLSPTADDFVGAISQRFTGNYQGRANPHGCQSLACFGEVASANNFRSFYSSIRSRYSRSNFLMLDYADRTGTMDFILWANRNYAQ